MSKMEYFSEIRGEFYKNKSLAPLTWLKVGGPAEYLFIPEDKADLIQFIKKYPSHFPKMIIGAGSNLLVRGGGVSGVVISMKNLNTINSNGVNIYAEAGALDMSIARKASVMGLSGLEF